MGCENCSFRNNHNDRDGFSISKYESNLCNKLNSHDWLSDVSDTTQVPEVVEIRFKNTRKEFYRNVKKLNLSYGDFVTVEAYAGFDVGILSLKGLLAEIKFKGKTASQGDLSQLKIIHRKASDNDLNTWQQAKVLEEPTMIKARKIAKDLDLDMKISDVEFQGDKKKAIFYYTAVNRVDFRELIKIYLQEFQVKIEMKQIGSRQEAGRIGGVGSCGQELCCSSWRTDFTTVKANAILTQQLPPNAEKYIGQCGKLKCCLMYELESYLEAKEDFPKELLELETTKGIAYPYKIDLLQKLIWYTFKINGYPETPVMLTLDRVKEIINLNKRGVKVEKLESEKSEKSA